MAKKKSIKKKTSKSVKKKLVIKPSVSLSKSKNTSFKKSKINHITKKKKLTKTKSSRKLIKGPKIGIFGGTFNPIHYGHMNSLETVYNEMNLKEMWIIPAFKNPLRREEEGPSPESRLSMLEIAVEALNHNHPHAFKVKDIEIKRAQVSYTIETLKEFVSAEPNNQYYLVIGNDQLEIFNQWKEYETIFDYAHLIVTSRPGSNLPMDRNELPDWLKALTVNFRKNKIILKSGLSVQFLQLKDIQVTATEVRRKIRLGEKVDHLTPNGVVEYIRNNKIYNEVALKVTDYLKFTKDCSSILNDKGGLDIRGYDVRSMVQPAEFTIAASGTSTRHTKALAEHVIREVKDKYHVYPQSTEGLQEGRWVVVDYGSLMIHIFYDFVRGEYRIEDLWSKAIRIQP